MQQREIFYVICRVGGSHGHERLAGMEFSEARATLLQLELEHDDGFFSYVTTMPPRRDTPSLRP